MHAPSRGWPAALLPAVVACGVLTAPTALAGGRTSALTPVRYIDHVRILASDHLGGRGPGSEGIAKAAEYIASRFREAGLNPAGDDGTFFQWFELPGTKKFEPQAARFERMDREQSFAPGRDWVPLPFSKPGAFEGPVAFVGYGIEAEEYGYNDYAGFDATGKVLVVLRYEPRSDDSDAKFGGRTPSRHSLFARKARVAKQHGAVALLIVNPPSRAADKDQLYRWRNTRQTYDLPMLHITRKTADALLAAGGLPSIARLDRQIVETRTPIARDLAGVRIRVEQGLSQHPLRVRNVVGLLPGRDAPDEYIVVGAHYDHLGTRGGRIFNGADDNASGTAGVIELARVLAAGPPMRRSVLFVTFTAEEMGLLGSAHFVQDPVVPLDQIRAMVNLDMIGRLRHNHLTLFGVPSGREFPELAAAAAEAVGLTYDAPPTRSRLFGASDHASFYRRDIPVLFAFTGMHPQYHRPPDDWERINPTGAVRVLKMMRSLIVALADMTDGPHFVPPDEQAADDSHDRTAAGTPPAMPSVRLGFAPDMQDEGPGLLLSDVTPGGPCDNAGLRKGDRILRIGDEEVKNLLHYVQLARKYKPGDEVQCLVLRNGRRFRVKVRFAPPE